MMMDRVFRVAVMAGLMLLAGAGLAGNGGAVRAQQQNVPGMPGKSAPGIPQPGVAEPDDGIVPNNPMRARLDEERKKAMNDDRHKRLEADVAKLQELTNELKTDVDKTNRDELSLDVIRKAGEIEKLAHDVQSRMKN